MPYCINDPTKTYKGDEPSPKGVGYCAHTEELGTIKNGLDKKKWIISITSKGVKRWVQYKSKKEEQMKNKLITIYSEKESLKEKWYDDSDKCDCSKFVSYRRKKHLKLGFHPKDIHGLEFEKGKLYKFISYNHFSKKPIDINLKEWDKYKLDKKKIEYNYCGSKKKLTKENPLFKKINHVGYKKYFTFSDQSGNYLVYIKKEKDPVYVYRIPLTFRERYFPENEYGQNKEWAYIQLVVKVIPEKIFIGKCPKDSKDWNCNGREGSSILLKINKVDYIYIGTHISTFTAKSEIVNFISLTSTKSDWTYSYAIDVENNLYLMLYSVYGNKNKKTFNNIYDPYKYYDEKKEDFKKMDNLKEISYYD